ncbi:MAG: pectinesterase family protein [Verrucomicrobiia bacterium]
MSRRRFQSGIALGCLMLIAVGTGSRLAADTNLTVAADGSAQFKTMQEAVNAVPQTTSSTNYCIIFIKPGIYKELIYVQREKRFVRLVGEDAEKTILTYDLNANLPGANGKPMGAFRTPSTVIDADDFSAENITFENSAGPVGQALAIRIDGDRVAFRNCRFLGWQDTILANRGRHYFEGCYIAGHVDFIFGGATVFFEGCHIHCLKNGYITAASTPQEQPFGYVFSHCKITGESPEVKTYLGRPWRAFASVAFLDTEMSDVIHPAGWDNWKNPAREKTARYAEFNNIGPGGISSNRVSWARHLTEEAAKAITVEHVLAGADGWNPKETFTRSPANVAVPTFTQTNTTFKTDIEYGEVDGEKLLLDACVPDGSGPFPVAIMVHGGGWSGGDKEHDHIPILESLTAAKFAWFSINYRLAPKHRWPACLDDVETAVRWVKAHAAEYKGDPQRIALIGYSAGGHLVCQAAVIGKDDIRVQAAVGFAPPTDQVADSERRGGLSPSLTNLLDRAKPLTDETRAVLREISPINYIKPGLPPFLLIHGTEDKSVPYVQSVNFQAKLKEAGVPCEIITVQGAPHRLTEWNKFDASYREKMIDWLNRTLGAATVSHPNPIVIKPDIMVAADGSGDFKTVQEALNSIPRDNRQRMIIFIKDGVYHEKVRVDPDFVTIRGQSRLGARIEFPQGADEFTRQPDDIGRAVVNINGSDCVLENLTIKNTHGVIGPHAFAVYGHGDKTVIVDCDVLSEGADTLALWGDRSGSYQARLNIRGSVDFVCPRGWCYMTDCKFFEVNPLAHASIWHDGSKDKDMKFVLRNCRFDGADNWVLARHHRDAQFFLLDCTFSKAMRDLAPKRVVYPIEGDKPSENDAQKNRGLDATNIWGERAYFYNCHRDGSDYAWYTNNLSSAPGAAKPEQITAAWTFAGKWDPERKTGPAIQKVNSQDGQIALVFGENVTVKGNPRLRLRDGVYADYASGSGTDTLVFTIPAGEHGEATSVDLNGGIIVASGAAAVLRIADVSLH